jgi:hypothetical protein
MTGEHHSCVIKLDGLLLKLDSHSKVIAVVSPRTAQTDGVSTSQALESVEDFTAEGAWEDTNLPLSPSWLGLPIDGRRDNCSQKQTA